MDKLKERLPDLVELKPDFFTVTYGAMGTSRERTLEIAALIRNQYRQNVAHHLTCVGSTSSEIERILDAIQQEGIRNIVALRGDAPEGAREFQAVEGGYQYASQLVEHIRQRGRFSIAVAGYPEKHPEAPDLATDIEHLRGKVDQGASLVLTQLFYDNTSFLRFRDACVKAGIEVPIVPGLLPILSTSQVLRITSLCGAKIPAALRSDLDHANPEDVHQIGIEYTTRQALDLLENDVDGLHFYVLNRRFHITEIIENIRPALIRTETAP